MPEVLPTSEGSKPPNLCDHFHPCCSCMYFKELEADVAVRNKSE